MTNIFWKPNRLVIASFFFVSATGLLLIIALNFLFNGTSESAVFWGLSTERLALLGGMFISASALLFLGAQTLRGKFSGLILSNPGGKSPKAINFMLGLALLTFCAAWTVTWTPAERFGTYYYYLGRLYPFIIWLTCFSAAGLILLVAHRFGLNIQQFVAFLREQRALWMFAVITLVIFGLLALAVNFRVVHMRWYEEDFWYGAGVPLLTAQVLFATLTSVALIVVARKFFTAKIEKKHRFDLIAFVAIWAIAGFLWANEPVNADFFITKPVAPNYELYPDYDAKFFDLFSQRTLIGDGAANDWFYDRPLYSALLVYLHSLFGQNYLQLMAWQAALFAAFPALGYILGRQLHSRALGAGLAILLTLRGLNSIALGPFINTVHQKQMMTDFPTAVLLLLMTVLLIHWLREPGKNWPSLAWTAGVVGLATLLRPHPFIYIPILIALTIWVYRSQRRLWGTFSGVILVAALAGVLPWAIGNARGQSVVDLYLQKIKNVIETRYPDLHLPGSSSLLAPLKFAAAENVRSYLIPAANPVPQDKSVLVFAFDNFLNNLTTSIQILPLSPYYQDLRYTTKTAENFWRPYWNGKLSLWGMVFLPCNLILLALGLATAWKRARWCGLVPLLVMLAYYCVDSLARTSGGRYIVPVDWVVVVYYFIGILALIETVSALFVRPQIVVEPVLSPPLQTSLLLRRATWLRLSGVIISFLLIGMTIPLSTSFFEQRYPPATRKQIAQQVLTEAGSQLGLSNKEWMSFLSSPQSVIIQGRILYPRQIEKDDGPKASVYKFYHPKPYPRMLFTLIGPGSITSAMFASMQAPNIPNASDAIILGCRESNYVQVWAVLLQDGSQLIKRTPATAATSLVCPLPEPVCDNNHHCR